MVSSDSTAGVAEGNSAEEGPQISPTRRLLQPSLERVPPQLRVQYQVLEILHIDNDPDLLERFLMKYGGAIRRMIDFHEQMTGQKLTPEVIIWCVGYDLHINLRQEVAQWLKAA